jgi:uncharacterized protein (DUF2342 family)
MNAESDSRVLGAIEDLVQLLQLAEGAAQRVAQEVHGPAFDHAELIARELQRLRRSADTLHAVVERFVGAAQPA